MTFYTIGIIKVETTKRAKAHAYKNEKVNKMFTVLHSTTRNTKYVVYEHIVFIGTYNYKHIFD